MMTIMGMDDFDELETLFDFIEHKKYYEKKDDGLES